MPWGFWASVTSRPSPRGEHTIRKRVPYVMGPWDGSYGELGPDIIHVPIPPEAGLTMPPGTQVEPLLYGEYRLQSATDGRRYYRWYTARREPEA